MASQLDTGTVVSGLGHAAVIGWALLGGLFSADPEPVSLDFTEVTVLSGEQFAALTQTPPVETPPVVAPETPEPPAPEAPEPPPDPVEPEAPPEPPEPPAPEEPPEPETPPDLSEVALPPEPELAPEAPTAPVAPQEDQPLGGALIVDGNPRPAPRPAPRVAPVPTAPPEPEVAPDIDTQTAAAPEPADEPAPDEEAQQETAPEEAGQTVAQAEEEAGGEAFDLAMTGSPRPVARPNRPVRPQNDAIADAVAEAVAEPAEPRRPSGPPMTAGEKDALRVAVQRCWNVGSLSTDALRVTVTLVVSLGQDGKPDSGSIRMIESSDGQSAAARQAYEAARRAVIRCGARGFDLPPEKYDEWRELELVFNPERMRVR